MKKNINPIWKQRAPGLVVGLSKLATTWLLAAGFGSSVFSQPTITSFRLSGAGQTVWDQPNNAYHFYRNFSRSTGALVYFGVTVSGAAPFTYQWQFNGSDLPGETGGTLGSPGAELDPGDYTVIVTDANSATTSQTAHLTLDTTFAKIYNNPITMSQARTTGGTWGDYDNNGYLDLFLCYGQDGIPGNQFLFQNNGGGTFTQIAGVPPVNLTVYGASPCWGDYDNDGRLDLYVAMPVTNLLYHNDGSGSFNQITAGTIVTDSAKTYGAAWADYDQDGFLDMFVTTFDVSAVSHCFLYRNNGDGSFSSVTAGALVTDYAASSGIGWADYDNDGKIDLFVCGGLGNSPLLAPNRLYHNNGDGTFTKISSGSIATDSDIGKTCAWGDYDNDGLLDLLVINGYGRRNFLYHNDGSGNFTRVLTSPIESEVGNNFCSSAWGDYDNDGFLDLYVTDEGSSALTPTVVNSLYHNNGDGTFTKVTTGSPANEYSDSLGCSWVDYDNDGFLDLFAARGDKRGSFLFHNNLPNTGNTNAWLTVRLVGTVSNRSAIGARVRVKAVYRGQSRWQLRQITGGGGTAGHNELQANFGLGDATSVDTLRIEWPSGAVQEFQNVAPNQMLTITEPPRLQSSATNGTPQFLLKGGRFMQYDILVSTNLTTWSPLGTLTITNLNGMAAIVDPGAPNLDRRFYRAVSH